MDLGFDVPQPHRLVGHAEAFKAYDHAEVFISDGSIQLSLHPETQLELQINCSELDRQLSSLAQVCRSLAFFPLISTLEELKIWGDGRLSFSHWGDDVGGSQWLELLDPFTALKNLYLTDKVA